MPKISEFYGIKIYIYWGEDSSHNLPHFHAFYGEHEATFRLNGELLIGSMPRTAQKLIKIWALDNHNLIVYAWGCAEKKMSLPTIKGLK